MAISIFPIPDPSFPLNASSYTVPLANTTYQLSGKTFLSGVYTITTFPTTSQARISFSNAAGDYAEVTTTSGTVTFNVAFDSTVTSVWTDTGTNVVVSLDRTSESLAGVSVSGTMDTITTSGTYNQTGKLYVVAISGGQGGGAGGTGPALPQRGDDGWAGGRGGESGGWGVVGPITVNSATTVTIGTGGARGTVSQNGSVAGSRGGSTSFGNYLTVNGTNTTLNRGLGGNPNGSGANQSASAVLYKNIGNGTTGGGGCGPSQYNSRNNGSGSGIGTGGGGAVNTAGDGQDATGYGAGGGGGGEPNRYSNIPGGNGGPGVIYVIRGF